jgi:hypothetical protein
MKKTVYISIIIGLSILLMFTSCEEVIEIELNNENPVIAAEGYIELDSVAKLSLTYSSDYFTNSSGSYIENSVVVITDDLGNVDTLQYLGEGNYQGENIIGSVNRTYRITFTESDNLYEASTTLFPPSEIIEVAYEEFSSGKPGHDEISYSLNMKFTDNISSINYYLIDVYINGNLKRDSYSLVESSNYSNNGELDYLLMRTSIKKDDNLNIRVYSIDEASYTFYSQMNDALGGGMMNSSTPYNPDSNFGPDVVGLFSGRSYVEDSVVVE